MSLIDLRQLQFLLGVARREEREVEIVVSECLYGCCHRPPFIRSGYEQTYRGLIADANERRLVLHAIAVSSLNYHVVAELEHVLEVALVD